MLRLDLHFYDNLIICDPIITGMINAIDHSKKAEAFDHLAKFITDEAAIKAFNVIVTDYKTFGRNPFSKVEPSPSQFHIVPNQNFDSLRGLYACDLLYLSYLKIVNEKNEDFIKALNDQLVDMMTGLCPVGRTTRLYQILIDFVMDAIENPPESKENPPESRENPPESRENPPESRENPP